MEKSYPNLISATIIKDSLGLQGDRITTFKLTMPRLILAELNTHRLFSKNSASSRAIPFKKMVKSALENPFIPIAFQKEHTGMQGTDYLDANTEYTFKGFKEILKRVFKYETNDIERILNGDVEEEDEIFNIVYNLMSTPVVFKKMTLIEWWLYCRDKAIESAIIMSALGVTKQLCNRILEPFLYHTVLLTATEYDNFFKLRCPQYSWEYEEGFIKEKSKEDFIRKFIERYPTNGEPELHDLELVDEHLNANNSVNWLEINKGAGEIHIMDLAEKMYDALNESTPEQLKAGEWHIPYGDNIDENVLFDTLRDLPILDGELGNPIFDINIQEAKLKIATARMARISYETLGDNPKIDYEADIKLHDGLLAMEHMSPFEHCAVVPTDEEYVEARKGKDSGWFYNFKGFKSYRFILENPS